MGKAALDGAQPHGYIMPGPDVLRGLAGIGVGKGVYYHIGIVRLNGLSNFIHELDQAARVAALPLVDGFAGIALAGLKAVVLGDGHYLRLWMLPEPLAHPVYGYLQDLRVCEERRIFCFL